MIIRTASFKNLHGYLSPRLSFDPGMNILIGVNGSGKTSVLNAMAWTLSPASVQGGLSAAYLLSETRFEEINIAYTIPGQRKYQRVTAKGYSERITIEIEGITGALEIPVFRRPERLRATTARPVDEPADLIARLLEDERDNLVLRELSQLPGPLYLPLNRRWTEDVESNPRYRLRRSTSAGHLPISEVVALAERVFRQEQGETFSRNETLRNDLLTSLFEVYEFQFSSRVWTPDELESHRKRMLTVLENLGLNDARKLSEEYFSKLEPVVKQVGGRSMPRTWQDGPQREIWFQWITEVSAIAVRIERLIPLIEKYEEDRIRINQRSVAFLDSVNSFIRDNGKELRLSRGADLAVRLPNGQLIGSQYLSSGELQLLILFTFLYFQFDNEQEFPVLVDEPELSLHIAWQNRYVESVKSANPNAQFIIATHSPEIAGPAEDAIRDISPRVETHD